MQPDLILNFIENLPHSPWGCAVIGIAAGWIVSFVSGATTNMLLGGILGLLLFQAMH